MLLTAKTRTAMLATCARAAFTPRTVDLEPWESSPAVIAFRQWPVRHHPRHDGAGFRSALGVSSLQTGAGGPQPARDVRDGTRQERDEAELRIHPGGRSRLCGSALLRRQRAVFAKSRQTGGRGPALHERLRQLLGLLAVSVCDRDRTVSAPAARRVRRTDRRRLTGLGAAPGTSNRGLTPSRRGLRDGADRQMAPGLAALVQSAQERLRRVLRASVGRGRLLHPQWLRWP